MTKLLLLAFMAVASQATAQECVRERAAMVETYSRLCAMGNRCFAARHIGERARRCRANGTPSIHPRSFLFGGIQGRPASHWPVGHDNVSVRVGDGYHGWPECGPFDAVIVTAALGHVPPPLIEQLKVGGRLVMPVGSTLPGQRLTVVEKIAPSETRMRSLIPVAFVPFTRSRDGPENRHR
jgi:hypothetical protein